MTATTITPQAHDAPAPPTRSLLPGRLGGDRTGAIPFTRLVRVELRKLTDTRAGRWLLFAIAGITAIALIALVFAGEPSSNKDFRDFVQGALIPQGVLLPLLGVLAATSEWSQRTGLVTFGLVPRRLRVGWAKLVAALLLGLGLVLVGLALAALATLAAQGIRGSDPSWSVQGPTWIGVFLGQLLGVAMGVAFGLVLQNTPAAVVAYFALPTVLALLGGLSWMQTPLEWINPNDAIQPFYNGTTPTGEIWAHLLVSQVLWVALPFALGMWRLRRSEVK